MTNVKLTPTLTPQQTCSQEGKSRDPGNKGDSLAYLLLLKSTPFFLWKLPHTLLKSGCQHEKENHKEKAKYSHLGIATAPFLGWDWCPIYLHRWHCMFCLSTFSKMKLLLLKVFKVSWCNRTSVSFFLYLSFWRQCCFIFGWLVFLVIASIHLLWS